MTELKSCPFCDAAPFQPVPGPTGGSVVECMRCHAEVAGPTRAAAVTAWNTRRPSPDVGNAGGPDLLDKMESIARIAAPGHRTLDELTRDMGFICDFARDAVRRTKEAALSPHADSAGWQPIETAPKDGASILVWWPIRKLDEEGFPTGPIVGGQSLVTEWNGGMWLEPEVLNCLNGNYFNDDAEYAEGPTHWRPLPDPPALAPAMQPNAGLTPGWSLIYDEGPHDNVPAPAMQEEKDNG